MRRTFWPNVIFQRFRSKNRSTGLKFTPIRENSSLSTKIVQNVLFTPGGGRFGQIAFTNVFGSKNCSTGLKFTPIREYSKFGLSTELTNSDEGLTLETSAFQSPYGGQFTLSTPLINQIFVKTVACLWKLYKTCFSRHAEDVLAKCYFSTF